MLTVLCLAFYVVGCGTDETDGPSSNGYGVSPNGNEADLGNDTETPTGTTADTPAYTPEDTQNDTPADTPADTQNDAPADTPADAATDAPEDAANDAPEDKPAPPAKPEGGTTEVDKSETEKQPVDDTKDDVDEED